MHSCTKWSNITANPNHQNIKLVCVCASVVNEMAAFDNFITSKNLKFRSS